MYENVPQTCRSNICDYHFGKDPTSISSCHYDISIGLTTNKFINLVKQDDNYIIELNKAIDTLEVKKCRIYDINVLEGIGIIEKKMKNRICWKGFHASGFGDVEHDMRVCYDDVDNLYVEE